MPEVPTQLSVRRAIAVCVDDFGLSPGVDEAVFALAPQGRISAVSCMTGAPEWRADAPALRALDARRLDLGLHLDLTEHPFDAQLRRPLRSWLLRTHLGLVPRAALRREIDAQLDAFEHALGRPPAHVDGHQHVHQLPVVRAELLAALLRRYASSLPWVRSTRCPSGASSRKAWLIEQLGGRAMLRRARAAGFGQNRHLLGVYDFAGDAARYLALTQHWLRTACHGDVLLCHPAARPLAGDVIAAARAVEYQVLSGAVFGAALEANGVAIRPLSALLAEATGADPPSSSCATRRKTCCGGSP